MKIKKLAVWILVLALIIGGSGGGFWLYQKNKHENTYVEVIPVSYISTSDENYSTYMSAVVVNNQRQEIMLTTSQQLAEVLVQDGQEVNIGDPVLRLDTSLESFGLQDLKIQIDKKNLEIYNGFQRLDKLMKTTPYTPGNDSPGGWDPWYPDDWYPDDWYPDVTEEYTSEEETAEDFTEEESSSEELSSEEESSLEELSSEEESSSEELSSEEENSSEELSSEEETSPEESTSEQVTEESSSMEEETEPTQPSETEPEGSSSTEEETEPTLPQETTPEETDPSAGEASTEEMSTEEPSTEQPSEPVYSADGKHELITGEVSEIEQAETGEGTKEEPYEFYCSYQAQLMDYELVEWLIENEVYAIMHIYDEDGVWAYDLDLSRLLTSESGDLTNHPEHEWELFSVHESCVTEGKEVYICKVCGAFDYKAVPMVSHQFGEAVSLVPETCISDGVTVRQCTVCGYLEKTQVAATGIHTVGEAIMKIGATCVTGGYEAYQCTFCGQLELRQVSEPTGAHSYLMISGGTPQMAVNIYQCTVCGMTYSESNPSYTAPTQPPTEPAALPSSEEMQGESVSIKAREHHVSAAAIGVRSLLLPPEEDFSFYTAEELAKEIQAQQVALRDADLERRKMELEYQKQEKELEEKTIIASRIKGIVKEMQDSEEMDYSKPFMIIDGGSGLFLKGSVAENLLNVFKPGFVFECQAWTRDGGMIISQATVTEVSEYPTDNNGGSYSSNPNTSYYPFAAYLDEEQSEGLDNGDWVDINLTQDGDSGALFIEMLYVRKEHNKYYVYARNPETKLLEKRYVTLGKTLWDYYYEIKSGLTIDDYIAVPYGKEVKEGVKTKVQGEDTGEIPIESMEMMPGDFELEVMPGDIEYIYPKDEIIEYEFIEEETGEDV